MDVTRLTGAQRAGDGRAPTAREAGPVFESFLPERGVERRPQRRDAERVDRSDRKPPAERADRQATERRAAERRAEARRDEARQLDERREARRAEERRTEAEREDERRAEAREARRSEAREAQAAELAEGALDGLPDETSDIELLAGLRPEARAAVIEAPEQPQRPVGDARRPTARPVAGARGPFVPAGDADDGELAGAQGLAGLVQWLEGRPSEVEGPRARRALELAGGGAPQTADAEPAESDPTALGETVDLEAGIDPATELTRLLEGRKLPGDRAEPGLREVARGTIDTVQIGPRVEGPGVASGSGPGLLSPAARIADASAAARAGSTPTALPEGVDESSIMRQISDALRIREGRIGRAQTAEIQLHPAELGRVRIKIHMEAGAARVHVSAEHAAVSDLLGAGLDQLRRDLMAQGVHIAHLEVQSGLAEDGGQRREAPEHDETDEREPPPEVARPVTRRARGRIDVEA